MKKYSRFDVILNLWISFVINVVLSIVLPALVGMLSFGTFLKGFLIAFTVSTILVFLIPVVDWGRKFASLFGLKPGTPVFTLVSTIVLALFLGTIMTLLMTAVNAGIGPHFFAAWWSCYGIALLTVYLSALVGIFTGIPLTKAIVGAGKP